MENNKINDNYNFPKFNTKQNVTKNFIQSDENSIDTIPHKGKSGIDDSNNKSIEEFWGDVNIVNRIESRQDRKKKNDDLSISKKNKYDNSLSKSIDFDDLITGGKYKKYDSDYMNLNSECFFDVQSNIMYTNSNLPETDILAKKSSNKSVTQASYSVTLTQPSTTTHKEDEINNNIKQSNMGKYNNSNNYNNINGKSTTKSKQPFSSTKSVSKSPGKVVNVKPFQDIQKSQISRNNQKLQVKIENSTVCNKNIIKNGNLNKPKPTSIASVDSKKQVLITPVKNNYRSISNEKIVNSTKPQNLKNVSVSPVKSIATPVNDQLTTQNLRTRSPIPHRPDTSALTTTRTPKQINKKIQMSKTPVKVATALSPPKNILPRLNSLYRKGKEKVLNMVKHEKEAEEIRKKNEMNSCTFKPKINNDYIPVRKNILNSRNHIPMYERQQLWNNKKQEKIEKEKILKENTKIEECTFAPHISKTLPADYRLDVDKPTMKFFERVNNAKKMKDEINLKLNPNYNEKYDKILKSKIKKDLQLQDKDEDYGTFNPDKDHNMDFSTVRKNLHSKLHSINIPSEL